MKICKQVLIAFLFGLLLYSCTSAELDTVCTQEQRLIDLTVLTPAGEPADSVRIEVSNKETSEKYNVCEELYGDSCDQDDFDQGVGGTYVIFADGLEEDLNEEREKVFVEVTGTRGNLEFIQEFTFEYDGCHVFKAAGPDTVSLKPQ